MERSLVRAVAWWGIACGAAVMGVGCGGGGTVRGDESVGAVPIVAEAGAVARFEAALEGGWNEVFFDPCDGDWERGWFLDGEIATVMTGPEGMSLVAGPEFGNDAHHAVLWTRESFEGDIKIEYEWTRLDDLTDKAVNILFLHATGSGDEGFDRDIAAWSETRRVPTMSLYYRNMNAYHISYAAYREVDGEMLDYVRARRYVPAPGRPLRGTELEPDAWETGLFEPGVPHRVTVVKSGDELFMLVATHERSRLFAWETDRFEDLNEGRIGLRHMFTRASRYRDFRVSVRSE